MVLSEKPDPELDQYVDKFINIFSDSIHKRVGHSKDKNVADSNNNHDHNYNHNINNSHTL